MHRLYDVETCRFRMSFPNEFNQVVLRWSSKRKHLYSGSRAGPVTVMGINPVGLTARELLRMRHHHSAVCHRRAQTD